ncbi:MAG: hypothetical protein K6G75_09330 [Lachnospiraceae bacterium]|nr:hypothetical protein [Lachnospiraceae bacterium]
MDIVDLDSLQPIEGIAHSSKGNQLKWNIDSVWYKADSIGYEGLSEVVSSAFFEMSNIKDSFQNQTTNIFVKYEPVVLIWQKNCFFGCRSDNFREDEWQLMTIEKLYRKMTGLSIAKEMAHIGDVKGRIELMVRFVENVTGLQEFGKYISVMLSADAFFLNEDRHTNNIAVMYNPNIEEYKLCPFFDYGAGLFSDVLGDYPIDMSIGECMEKIEAKPFNRDFDEQSDAACELYHGSIKFLGKKELISKWNEIRKEYEKCSETLKKDKIKSKGCMEKNMPLVLDRVEEVLRGQIRKYGVI